MSEKSESSLATRPSLLARLKDWNQQTAWREFDHDYTPLLRNVARKAGLTETEADEVAQECLIAVAKKIREFEHAGRRGSFRAWLYQQARWRIADQFRARARADRRYQNRREAGDMSAHPGLKPGAPVDERAEATHAASEAGAASAVEIDPAFERLWDAEWNEHLRRQALERIKRRVSARQFQLFDLHVLQGLPVRAAAEASGASMAAVYMAKSRVGRLLRREVKLGEGLLS